MVQGNLKTNILEIFLFTGPLVASVTDGIHDRTIIVNCCNPVEYEVRNVL